MNELVKQITDFLRRKPRFNVVLVKSARRADQYQMGRLLDYETVDPEVVVASGALDLEELSGYTDILDYLRLVSNSVAREGVIMDIDLLLSCLNREKRAYFFQSVLQKTFRRPVVLLTSIFRDEVPDVSAQEFNYARVIDWGQEYGASVR